MAETSIEQKQRSGYRWIIMILCWLAVFCMFSSMTQLAPLSKTIIEVMGISGAMYSVLYSSPLLAVAVLVFLAGSISDKIGSRITTCIGMTLVAVCAFSRGFAMAANNYGLLLILNFCFGIGFGMVYPNLPKLVAGWFTEKQRGIATSVYSTGVNFGSFSGITLTIPLVLPIAREWYNVPHIWGILAIACCVLLWLFLRNTPAETLEREQIAAGAVKEKAPLFDRSVLTNKSLIKLSVTMFCTSWIFYVLTSWWTIILTSKGADTTFAATCTGMLPLAGLLASLIAPALSQKLNRRTIFIWGSQAVGLVLFLLLFVLPVNNAYMFIVFFIGLTVNTAFAIENFMMPADLVPRNRVASASGVVMTLGYISALVGPFVAGVIWDATANAFPIMVSLVIVYIVSIIVPLTIKDPLKERRQDEKMGAAATDKGDFN